MDSHARFSEALAAYQDILEQHGHGRAEIYKKSHLARCILGQLKDAELDNTAYRQAVDAVRETMPDPASSELCRRVGREFHPFLCGDMDAVRMLAEAGAYQRGEIRVELPPHSNLDELIRICRGRALNDSEHLAISDYTYALQVQGLSEASIQNRTTIALMLLVGMHVLPRDGNHYRAVVDRLLQLFTQEKSRDYFLAVAREFFGFMLGNPDASVALSQDLSRIAAGGDGGEQND